MSAEDNRARPGYRPYRASVVDVRRLSPTFVRVGFTGPDLGDFADHGRDQRVKLVFPHDDRSYADLGLGAGVDAGAGPGDWYARWRALPEDRRPPFRTYTVRAVDATRRRVHIDFAVHAENGVPIGPGARWLHEVRAGDEVMIVGPDALSPHSRTGMDWKPGAATEILLVGDETAAPAIAGILERLPPHIRATALIEVPEAGDALEIVSSARVDVRYLPRRTADGSAAPGALLTGALHEWRARNRPLLDEAVSPTGQRLEDIDVDAEILWDTPEPAASGEFYAWLAGEAAVIRSLRRLLVTEWGVDRRRVAFMGYWRRGVAERIA